jgi:hypothetical protein
MQQLLRGGAWKIHIITEVTQLFEDANFFPVLATLQPGCCVIVEWVEDDGDTARILYPGTDDDGQVFHAYSKRRTFGGISFLRLVSFDDLKLI